MKPMKLAANQPPARFYAGGHRISEFRGVTEVDFSEVLHTPEDWVGSTTTVAGSETVGLTQLASGDMLRDAVTGDPQGWFGPQHTAKYGTDSILVKLLDAGERLPVHIHPDVPFAQKHLGLNHGKTEGWIALKDSDAHIAFCRDVTVQELRGWVDSQDTTAMIGAMHKVEIKKGDALFLPAGLPHAIGKDNFIVELQEPTDLSILLEWDGYPIDGATDGHLGLGFDTALGAVDRRGWSAQEVQDLFSRPDHRGEFLPQAKEFFRARQVSSGDVWDANFSILIVVSGSGTLSNQGDSGAAQTTVDLNPGDTVLVPFAAGNSEVFGDEQFAAYLCQPPL